MAQNINRVTITGNLTSDPELRALPSGTSLCKLRVAVNGRTKTNTGEWVDKPNFFDVTVWGSQGENCARYLARGRPVAVDGRLDWREWETPEGAKRQAVQIVADTVQFLGGREDGGGSTARSDIPTGDLGGFEAADTPAPDDLPANEFTQAGLGGFAPVDEDDSIPFLWGGPVDWHDRYHANR